MKAKNILPRLVVLAIAGIVAANILLPGDSSTPPPSSSPTPDPTPTQQMADLVIVSGSENEALEPVIMDWANANKVSIAIKYLGSVDISLALESGKSIPYDAVWPANSLWIELGDSQRVVKHEKSIFRSPVVLGLRKSKAEQLGWVGKDDIQIQDILTQVEANAFSFAMTSATQSNSGASAYIGFLYAMAGNPDILTEENLADTEVLAQVKRLLGKVNRGSGSSGWLKSLIVQNPDRFDAMFNYEAMIIEANQELMTKGGDPLCAIYPANGIMVADSPLGYVDKGDANKEELFLKLQEHLLSKPVQEQLRNLGRRAGLLGMSVDSANKSVWNPDWCIDAERDIAPVPTPAQTVIRQALDLYQTGLRKPSLTVWVLDVSGSMGGAGIDGLHQAMHALLDPTTARRNLLQPSAQDITIVIPFNHEVRNVWKVEGNDPAELADLLAKTQNLEAAGGTDLYRALVSALEEIRHYNVDGALQSRLPAIVAMTDGASDTANRDYFLDQLKRSPIARDIPIHTISFGKSDESQLGELSEMTLGRMFKSKGNLPETLRKAKGYN